MVAVRSRCEGRNWTLAAAWVASALGVFGCDWRDFSDIESNSSVVVLEQLPGTAGFGRSLATASDRQLALIVVSGTPSRSPSAAFSIGFEQSPATDAAQEGYCERGGNALASCYSSNQPAFFAHENASDDDDLCFAHAWGQGDDANRDGVLLRCFRDGADITLEVPGSARNARQRAFDQNEDNQPLFFASDRGDAPWLLAALSNQNQAWYYRSELRPDFVSLPVPEAAGDSFGRQVAVLRVEDDEDQRVLAVSAPEQGQVWLYRAVGDEVALSGCLGIRPDFGRTLAAGPVNRDGFDELIVAEEDLVTVFSGEALASLPEAFGDTCTLAALPENAILGSFGCGSRFALSGCSRSEFGASLAVGDLDGDDDGEVIVGAPQMVVNGNARAGAVLVYDVEGSSPHRLSDVLYLSSAEEGDLLGSSVGALSQKGEPDVVVAGGPGKGKVAVYYCSELIDPEDREGRCTL